MRTAYRLLLMLIMVVFITAGCSKNDEDVDQLEQQMKEMDTDSTVTADTTAPAANAKASRLLIFMRILLAAISFFQGCKICHDVLDLFGSQNGLAHEVFTDVLADFEAVKARHDRVVTENSL